MLLLVFIVATVLFILGMSLADLISQSRRLTLKYGDDMAAYYAAQAGIDRVLWRMRNLFEEPLVRVKGEGPKADALVNTPLLEVLDYDKARDWARTFTFAEGDLIPGATCTVHAELVQVTKNHFYTFIDRVEPNVPESLERYREQKDRRSDDEDIEGKEALAGWAGLLRVTSEGVYQGTRRVIEVAREIKVHDITPPAPDHTLFIAGNGSEKLEEGRFLLSNLDLPEVIQQLLLSLTLKANELLRLDLSEEVRDVVGNADRIQDHMTNGLDKDNVAEALRLAFDLASHVHDEAIKDKVDSIILSLNPRNWGRVRTNGTLNVKLPFFAADDIVNYFADNTIFGHQRPEVGFLYHDNRLHDPYLGVYTHFEGMIYKEYRRLNPLSMGPSTEPTPVAPQRYTINTQFNYVDRYPDRKLPGNLDRLKKHAKTLAHQRFRAPVVRFLGTPKNPIRLDGLWYCDGKVELGGPYQGRGLIVGQGEIRLLASLEPVNPGDSLSLAALQGSIKMDPNVREMKVRAGLYAKDGIVGTQQQTLDVQGNLVVDKLGRDRMPRYFTCRFDPDLKNHLVDNIVGVIARTFTSYKEKGAAASWSPVRVTADHEPWSEPLKP